MTFGVHWNGAEAEAYRISHHARPRLSHVMANALAAIERASGCRVREGSLRGDAAIVRAGLVCPGGTAAPRSPPRVEIAGCAAGDSYVIEGLATEYTAVECDVLVSDPG